MKGIVLMVQIVVLYSFFLVGSLKNSSYWRMQSTGMKIMGIEARKKNHFMPLQELVVPPISLHSIL